VEKLALSTQGTRKVEEEIKRHGRLGEVKGKGAR
jgi:hypothetical protein